MAGGYEIKPLCQENNYSTIVPIDLAMLFGSETLSSGY